MTSFASALPLPPADRLAGEPRRRVGIRTGNLAMFIFVAVALLVSMSVTQKEAPEPGSVRYWILLMSAGLLPLTDVEGIVRALFGRARLLLLFLACAGAWNFLNGDVRAVLQMGLLVWVTAWISADNARLDITLLIRLYAGLIVLGCLVYVSLDLNHWGEISWLTIEEYGIWRVSFFPNIAYTAFLSLALVLVLTRNRQLAAQHPVILALALYFMIASFVRAALIAALIYAVLHWWSARKPTATRLFRASLLLGISVNLAVASSVVAVTYLQEFPLFSRLFLRGESGLSTEEIFQQLFRPWLWWEHLRQFWSSPSLMEWGAFDFETLKDVALIEGQEQGDSVSLLTRLLAAYGLPGALFTAYLVICLHRSAKAGDAWACACFAPILFLLLQWGSVFHPSDALFVILLLPLVRGSAGFVVGQTRQAQ